MRATFPLAVFSPFFILPISALIGLPAFAIHLGYNSRVSAFFRHWKTVRGLSLYDLKRSTLKAISSASTTYFQRALAYPILANKQRCVDRYARYFTKICVRASNCGIVRYSAKNCYHFADFFGNDFAVEIVRHVTGNDKDCLRKIPRVVW